MNRVENGDEHANGQGNGQSGPAEATLSPMDAVAVDAILDRSGDTDAPVDAARKNAAAAWLGILGADPEPMAPNDLLERTLALVKADRMKIPASAAAGQDRARQTAARSRWRRHVAEFAAMAVAAALFIAVTIDLLGEARQSQKRIACQANLQKVAGAFANYAGDADGQLPMLAMPENHNWLTGTGANAPRNNAANLLPLVFGKYMPVTALFCAGAGLPASPVNIAGNALPEIGYSYRNLYGPEPAQWDGRTDTIMLSDRNPVFVDVDSGGGGNGAKAGAQKHNSPNHGGRGDYLLRADQSVSWEVTPNAGPGGDNIWTLGAGKEQIDMYAGTEVPKTVADVFMCP